MRRSILPRFSSLSEVGGRADIFFGQVLDSAIHVAGHDVEDRFGAHALHRRGTVDAAVSYVHRDPSVRGRQHLSPVVDYFAFVMDRKSLIENSAISASDILQAAIQFKGCAKTKPVMAALKYVKKFGTSKCFNQNWISS